jgi:short-subunit dehydrogenase
MTNVENLLAVVTGASSGIGKAIALELSKRDTTLCLLGRNPATLQSTAKAARSNGADVHCFSVDLLLNKDIHAFNDDIQRDFGCVDVLIHSAGVIALGKVEHAPVEDFDRQYRINLRAPYLLTQLLLPMIKDRHGQIVFINSSAGLKTNRGNIAQYAATKHGLKAMADSLREEVHADDVRVITIFPGSTATPMQEYVQKMEGKLYQSERFMKPEDIARVVINTLDMPRTVRITDVNCF